MALWKRNYFLGKTRRTWTIVVLAKFVIKTLVLLVVVLWTLFWLTHPKCHHAACDMLTTYTSALSTPVRQSWLALLWTTMCHLQRKPCAAGLNFISATTRLEEYLVESANIVRYCTHAIYFTHWDPLHQPEFRCCSLAKTEPRAK